MLQFIQIGQTRVAQTCVCGRFPQVVGAEHQNRACFPLEFACSTVRSTTKHTNFSICTILTSRLPFILHTIEIVDNSRLREEQIRAKPLPVPCAAATVASCSPASSLSPTSGPTSKRCLALRRFPNAHAARRNFENPGTRRRQRSNSSSSGEERDATGRYRAKYY